MNVENNIKRRWGIVGIAVAMFFVTFANTTINGQKGSIYYAVWVMVGVYGYRGNLEQIKWLMKILLGLNAVGLLGILIFVQEDSLTYMFRHATKENMMIGVLIMSIPKLLMYMYCEKQIKEKLAVNEKSNQEAMSLEKKETNKFRNLSVSQNKIEQKKEDVTNQLKKSTEASVKKEKKVEEEINEEKIWEQVAEEFDTNSRKKGLYAKLFAETNGDEVKIKALYYKTRFEELINELKELVLQQKKSIETNKTSESLASKRGYKDKTNEECISQTWYDKFSMNGYDCFDLYNGKAVVITPTGKIIYRNLNALNNAMLIQERTGVFTKDDMVSETQTQ